MPRRTAGLLTFFAVGVVRLAAQDAPAGSAVLELQLPPGATVTADGKPVDDPRSLSISELKTNEIRRVKLAVKYAEGQSDERLVDVAAGQRIPVPLPLPGPEKALVIGMQPLVPIHSAAVRRDGRYIAVGLDDRNIVLWDTTVGRPTRTLTGHQKAVLAVAFTPDGKHLLSGSGDATAVLWDVDSGRPVRTYKGHTAAVVSVAFAPDGSQILTGSSDGTAVLWKTQTAERVHTLAVKSLLAVAYSPDGNLLGTSSADRIATLWDAKTGKSTFVLRGHREDVNCIAFSPDSKRVVTGSSDDSNILWDATTGRRIGPAGRHGNNVHTAVFTPNGQRIVSGEREELVMMWNAATGANVRTLVGHGGEILSILPAPDGRTMLTASKDGTARFWDLATGRELATLTTDGARKTWAVVSADGLFDSSDPGRRSLGYRFPKITGGEIDQFFTEGYRPGLLAQLWRGDRPVPARPIGLAKAPLVKLVPIKGRAPTDPTATLHADVTDQGAGAAPLVVENNGVRLAVTTKSEPAPGGKATRVTFTVPLAPGANKIRVRSATADGSRESAGSEVELAYPESPGGRGRLYIVAVGIGDYAEKGLSIPPAAVDARGIAEFLRTRGGKAHDRADVVPVFDRDATRTTIEDTIKDVAELTRPQDSMVVVLCGRGSRAGDRLVFAPHDLRSNISDPEDAIRTRGLATDDVAAAMGTAAALNRILIVDVTSAAKGATEFGLRGTVERWGRTHGVLAFVAVTPADAVTPDGGRGPLARALLDPAAGKALDVADWLQSAADRANTSSVVAGTRAKSFPFSSDN